MLFPIKNRKELKDLEELVLLKNHVKAVRLLDKHGKQNFHEDMKTVFVPLTKTIKEVSDDVTKTMMITSKGNNLALENFKKNF